MLKLHATSWVVPPATRIALLAGWGERICLQLSTSVGLFVHDEFVSRFNGVAS